MKAKPKLLAKTSLVTSQFKIERGIPLASRKRPKPYQDTFSAMKVDDSFLIGNDEHKIQHVCYNAVKYGRDNEVAFAFRITDEGKRCWRVK